MDIRDFGACASPNDIGPAVQAALSAAVACGGASVLIPPRDDGTKAWGWSTLAAASCLDRMGIDVIGVPHETVIGVPVGLQNSLCQIGASNARVSFEHLIFRGGSADGINAPALLTIAQARIGRLVGCEFWSLACDAADYGLVRIVADTTHVEDALFSGCGYWGPAGQAGVLTISGQRDACRVLGVRFSGPDGAGQGGQVRDKSSATGAHVWVGGQGTPTAPTAYGEVLVDGCYFEAGAANAVFLRPPEGLTCDRVRVRGCTFNAPSNNDFPIYSHRVRQLVVEGAMFGNSAANQYAIGFQGETLIVRESHGGTGGKRIKFTGPTDYVSVRHSPGFSLDTSAHVPAQIEGS